MNYWQQIKTRLGAGWRVIDSNIGGALMGGVLSYLLTKTHREKELEAAKEQLDENAKLIKSLQLSTQEADRRNLDQLAQNKDIAASYNASQNALLRCQNNNILVKFAFANSTCLYRFKVIETVEDQVPNVPAPSKKQSGSSP